MFVRQCVALGGTQMDVTVPAGTFNSCYLESEGQELYFAAVPFSFAKIDSPASGVSLELVSSRYR